MKLTLLLALAVALLLPVVASADTVGWQHPQQLQDGTPIAQTAIKKYIVRRNETTYAEATPNADTTQTIEVVKQFGQNRVKVSPVDFWNREGATSNEIILVPPTPTPVPTATPTATPPALISAPVLQQIY